MSVPSFQVVLAIAGVAIGFWVLPMRWRWPALSGAGLGFLGCVAPQSAGLLVAVTVSSFIILRLRPTLIWTYLYAIAVFILMLVLRSSEGGGWAWFGAAFYVLRATHIVVDSARGTMPKVSPLDFATYMAFPPILPVGPVERFPWFQREMQRCRWNSAYLSAGLETLLYGYAQVVLLANYFIDDSLWSAVSLVSNDVLRDWLECLRYGASLYFKFAGYSDIAIGFALLLGIRIRENFRRPYLAANIADFWRRWNISVTSWCRDYVNLPVLALTRNRSLAALTSMVVLGLWHEASWRYLLWGAFHGTGIAIWRGWRGWREALALAPGRVEAVGAWALTMLFVIAGFAITKEDTMIESLHALALLAGWRIG
jgi:alginate O-acetyltransferase complex protein AlgI